MRDPLDDFDTGIDSANGHGRSFARLAGTLLVRVIVPLWILTGAILKWWSATPEQLPGWIVDMLREHAPPELYYETWNWLLRGIIAIEMTAAALMIFFSRPARIVAVIMLLALFGVAISEVVYQAKMTGLPLWQAAFEGDCGCFGAAASVPAGVVLLIDATLLAGVACLRPASRPLRETPKALAIAGLLAIFIAATLGLNPRLPEHHATERLSQKYSPHYWVGWKFEETGLAEWLNYSVDPATYGGGRQTWIIYRDSCPTCHSLFLQHYSEPELDHVVIAVRVLPGPEETFAEEPQPVTCPACQFVDIEAGYGGKYNIPTPSVIEIDEHGVVTRVDNPLLMGHPQHDDDGDYRHGTEDIQETWRREMLDE